MHHAYSNGTPQEIIQRLLKAKGFTSPTALASAAGIPQPTLTRFLSGKSTYMETPTLMALARVLEVTVSELLGEVPISSGGRVQELAKLMQQLPEPEQAALIAAGHAMADSVKRAK